MSALELKDIGPDDEVVLFQLFTTVRSEELRMDHWDPDLRTQMLRLQFDAQRCGTESSGPTSASA
jgi:hypothetical protein